MRTPAQLHLPELCRARPALVASLDRVIDASCREWLLGALPVLSPAELEQAAASVLDELQALLAPREGERLEGAWRRELWGAQEQVVLALAGRRAVAKRLQLEAAGGRPLTVCFGRRTRTLPLPEPYELRAFRYGDGCGLVHPDSTGLRRPSFRLYCKRCRGEETARKRKAIADNLATSQARFPVLLYDETGKEVMGWWGRCSRCGEDFFALDARVRRCERCRQGHR